MRTNSSIHIYRGLVALVWQPLLAKYPSPPRISLGSSGVASVPLPASAASSPVYSCPQRQLPSLVSHSRTLSRHVFDEHQHDPHGRQRPRPGQLPPRQHGQHPRRVAARRRCDVSVSPRVPSPVFHHHRLGARHELVELTTSLSRAA